MALVYNCESCNYETLDSSNFNRHVKSITHAKLITNFKKIEGDYQKLDNECDDCGMKFKYKTSMYKHRRTSCKNLKIVNYVKTDESEKIKKLEEELALEKLQRKNDAIESLQKELKSKENEITNLNKMLNTAGKVVKQTALNTGKTLDVMKYLMDNYPNAPPLKAIPLEKFSELAVQNHSFAYTFIHYFREKKLDDHIADFFVKVCKQADMSKNSMCIKDLTRDSFYYVNADGKWSQDKKGDAIATILLKPLFDYANGEMTVYNKEQNHLTRNMKLKSTEMNKFRKNNEDGVKIVNQMKNGKLKNKIIRKIAVHFVLQCNDKKDYEKLQEIVETLEKSEN
jgi:hypothetical protein